MVKVALYRNSSLEDGVLQPVYKSLIRRGFDVVNEELAEAILGVGSLISEELISDKTIIIPHGVGDIDVYPVKSHFVSGSYFEVWARIKLLEKYGRVEENQIRVTGWPKLDILFQPEEKRVFNEVAERYELKDLPHDRTVLYAPTSSVGNTNSFDFVITPLLSAIERIGLNLLIKTHNKGDVVDGEGKSLWGQWTRIEEIKSKKMENVRWISSDENITYLYPFSHILVSGVSSCLREFMVMDRPSIQIDSFPFVAFKPTRIFEGVIHTQISQLEHNLKNAIDDPDLNKVEREVWKEFIFYKVDGKSSDRVVDALIEVMDWR